MYELPPGGRHHMVTKDDRVAVEPHAWRRERCPTWMSRAAPGRGEGRHRQQLWSTAAGRGRGVPVARRALPAQGRAWGHRLPA